MKCVLFYLPFVGAIYPKKEEFNKLVSHDGYSLRINAFFAWLRRSGYSLEYIAERLATAGTIRVLIGSTEK